MEGCKDQTMDSDEEFDINSYIEVNIDQTNVDTIVKNEMGHPLKLKSRMNLVIYLVVPRTW